MPARNPVGATSSVRKRQVGGTGLDAFCRPPRKQRIEPGALGRWSRRAIGDRASGAENAPPFSRRVVGMMRVSVSGRRAREDVGLVKLIVELGINTKPPRSVNCRSRVVDVGNSRISLPCSTSSSE
jgi:hypothetical protein